MSRSSSTCFCTPLGVVSTINDRALIMHYMSGRVLKRPTPRRGRPPNSDGQETAARLIDAAAQICAEQGFEGATMSRITRRAGVTPAAIYNHFESREDLLYAAGIDRLQKVTDVVPPGSGADA